MVDYRGWGLRTVNAYLIDNKLDFDLQALTKVLEEKGASLDIEDTTDGKLLVIRVKI